MIALTFGHCDKCDRSSFGRNQKPSQHGVEFYLRGTPVLFLCGACAPHEYLKARAQSHLSSQLAELRYRAAEWEWIAHNFQ